MFNRYKLTVKFGGKYIYEKDYKSINQVFRCISGFLDGASFVVYDYLSDRVLDDTECHIILKEFRDVN